MVAINRLNDCQQSRHVDHHVMPFSSTTGQPNLMQPSVLSPVDRLSEDQQDRLSTLLDQYLAGLENGEAVEVDALVENHPDLADIFKGYLHNLRSLYEESSHGETIVGESNSGRPEKLGDFVLERVIGRGGMGTVYEATQCSLSRKVALKILPLASSLDAVQVARFQNEARGAGLLQHPNIVPIYGVGNERGTHFFAMQFIDGQSLDHWIDERRETGSFEDYRVIIRWGIEIANALHEAHCAGVIHRDVKPSNLIVDQKGKIWITDFGLARVSVDVSLTGSGEMLGTVRYMSPEQAAGRSALVDGRCDVYSLAATLYELLVLSPAYSADNVIEVLRQIDAESVIPIGRLRPNLPRDLETVINKAMAKDRDRRYETASEFADDLRKILNGQPTVARPPTTVDHLSRYAWKHRKTALVVMAFLVVASISLSIATTVFASLQHSANIHANRALQKERLARNAVEHLGSRTAELLADIPAASGVRSLLLEETLDYFQRLAADAQHDPELKRDLALTLSKIGVLQSELGDTQTGIESLQESERVFVQLINQSTDDDTLLVEWSTVRNNLGEVFSQIGRYEEAVPQFAGSIKTLRELLTKHDDPSYCTKLAISLNNLGVLLSNCGASEEAQAHYEEAKSLLTDKQDCEMLRAAIDRNICSLITNSDPQSAVHLATNSLKLQLRMLEKSPRDVGLSAELMITFDKLGLAYLAAKDFPMARDSFLQGIRIGEEMLPQFPGQAKTIRSLATIWNHLGLISIREEKTDQASTEFNAAKTYASQLLDLYPHVTDAKLLHENISHNLEEVYLRSARPANLQLDFPQSSPPGDGADVRSSEGDIEL